MIDKEKKRLQEFKNWLEYFVNSYKEESGQLLKVIENADEILNDWYWARRDADVIPYMIEENGKDIVINQYKIISGAELAVISIQPILHENSTKRSELNAKLAWFIGLSILLAWNNIDLENPKYGQFLNNNRVEKFIEEHLVWLTKLDIEFNYPVFSNSHTWWNFHLCLDLFLGNEQIGI